MLGLGTLAPAGYHHHLQIDYEHRLRHPVWSDAQGLLMFASTSTQIVSASSVPSHMRSLVEKSAVLY